MSFEFLSLKCLLVCTAYLAAGIIDAVCGGGGLITVPALVAIGVPAHLAVGTNQCSALPGGLASLFIFAKNRKIAYGSGIIAAAAAILGGMLGARLNLLIPEIYLKRVMTVLTPLLALLLFMKKDAGEDDLSGSIPKVRAAILSAVIGLTVGTYQGFYGPGAGTLYVLAFAFIIKLGLIKASGTAKLATFFASVSSSVTYAFSDVVLWRIVPVATAFYILGSYFGARLALKNGAKLIRPFMLLVIGALFITLIVK